ncbi:hypothetical protein ACFLQZ_02880 [Acidobacteriota bacterium]
MYKNTIDISLDQYLKTGSKEDYEKLLLTLIPMTRNIAGRYSGMNRHFDDLIQEILLALWKNQRDVNKLKLMRMRANSPNGNGFKISTYYFFIIRAYCAKCADKLTSAYSNGFPYNNFVTHEPWMGNLSVDEGEQKFKRESE